MSDPTVRVGHVAGLGSSGAISHILLVHDHCRLTDAAHSRSISSMGLRMRRRIALIGDSSLALHHGSADRAMALAGILAALKALAGGASLQVFCEGQRVLVVGMIAADGGLGIARLISGVVDGVPLDGPKPFLHRGWVHSIGGSECQPE